MQVYANLPLPLAAALDLEPGEKVTWKVFDRTHLLLLRLPERKKLKGEAVPRPQAALAVEIGSQLISGVEVLAGNAGEQEKALALAEESQGVMEAEVEETVGDCA